MIITMILNKDKQLQYDPRVSNAGRNLHKRYYQDPSSNNISEGELCTSKKVHMGMGSNIKH